MVDRFQEDMIAGIKFQADTCSRWDKDLMSNLLILLSRRNQVDKSSKLINKLVVGMFQLGKWLVIHCRLGSIIQLSNNIDKVSKSGNPLDNRSLHHKDQLGQEDLIMNSNNQLYIADK